MVYLEPVDVTVQHICPGSGRVVRTTQQRATRIGFVVDDDGRRTLAIGRDKLMQEWAVAGGVRMHTRFVIEGKATLHVVRRNVQLMISGAEPPRLRAWIGALQSGRPPSSAADDGPFKRPLMPRSPNVDPTSPGGYAPKRREYGLDETPRAAVVPRHIALSPGAEAALTDEQQTVLRAALAGESFFFTGGAGTGKSYLLKQILARLPADTTFATATTGVAACAIGGVTLHHWAGIGGGDRPVGALAQSAVRKRGVQWRSARTLVVDEVSMLDAELFEKLDAVARAVRGRPKSPFGGLQLILVGDFFQLPPVAKGPAEARYAFEASCWDECVPRSYELTRVFRQQDDEFIDALSELRLGVVGPTTSALLKQCRGRALPEDDGIVATRLFTHKADCERINREQLSALKGQQVTIAARDSGDDPEAIALLKTGCSAPESITLKEGAQVVLTKTLDSSAGLVNGARGVVIKFVGLRNPVVRFDAGVTQTIRMESFTLTQAGRVVASRMQLPLNYGWALSVHKAQGMSLDRVQMSLGRVFECGQAYVALSRARSLEGLSLIDIDLSKVRAHPKVLEFHKKAIRAAASPAASAY